MKNTNDPSSLVNRLVADLTPVKRPLPAIPAALAWTLASSLVALPLVSLFNFRADLTEKFKSPFDFFVATLLLGGAGSLGFFAFRSGIPGRDSVSWARRVVWGIVGALVLALSFAIARESPGSAVEIGLDLRGARCSALVGLFAVLPAAALLIALKTRYATVRPRYAGKMLGGAAGFLGALFISLHCPVDEGLHILVWHVGPVLLIAWIFSAIAMRFLRF